MLKWVVREGELQKQNQKPVAKEEVVLNSKSMLEVSWQGSQYLKLLLVNFSFATFFYAYRIFLDKVRPDINVLLLVFLHI